MTFVRGNKTNKAQQQMQTSIFRPTFLRLGVLLPPLHFPRQAPTHLQNLHHLTSAFKRKKRESQPSMSNFVRRTLAGEKHLIDKQIAKAIFATNSSFRCIENSEVKKAIHLLRPGYSPPSRKTVASSLLDEIYTEEKEACFSSLSGKSVNMSIDGWSNIHNEPVICATLTTEDGRALLYETIDTSGKPHTSTYLTDLVCDLISSCQTKFQCQVRSFVTDNAANMTAMRKTLKS